MGSGNPAKVRRHTASVAQLRERSQALAERRNVEGWGWKSRGAGTEGWNPFDEGLGEDEQRVDVNWPIAMLPLGARMVGFEELAMRLALDPRGYCLATGVERGAAGLERFAIRMWSGEEGAAFSFCVDGRTYTAFEDPSDGCRSSMGWMVEREGNWCSERFEPCALAPEFQRTEPRGWEMWSDAPRRPWAVPPSHPEAGHADVLALLDPSTRRQAVVVGTSRSDEFYPSFVGWHSPEVLESARRAHVALAYELDAEIAPGAPARRQASRL